jgi:pyrroloquinoline quinone (PQQ) biosynthesis protein C
MNVEPEITQNGIENMWNELVRMVNEQFDSPPFQRLLGIKFTKKRAQEYSIQMAYYVKNRRDCWGYVQGAAPLDVKKLIWEHEQDELIGNKAEGKQDHIALAVTEGEVLGLKAEAFQARPVLEGGIACFYSWLHLAQRQWLEAIAASAVLEMRNSSELIRGGSLSRRIGEKFERELGIPMKKQVNNAEHVVMDVEHAHLLMRVARKHATTDVAQKGIIRGAKESLLIDRVYRGHLADMLESLP